MNHGAQAFYGYDSQNTHYNKIRSQGNFDIFKQPLVYIICLSSECL